MILIGVTGSYGTGKSTVAEFFKRLGARVIDADKIVHDLFRPRTLCCKKIVKTFGPGILTETGAVDRGKLSGLVFDSPKRLKTLESLIHPEVIRQIKGLIAQYRKNKNVRAVVVDVPLLYESGLNELMDINIVVRATQKDQLSRTASRPAMSRAAKLKRIRAQIPLLKKMAWADIIIDNRGALKDTQRQVRKVWQEYIK